MMGINSFNRHILTFVNLFIFSKHFILVRVMVNPWNAELEVGIHTVPIHTFNHTLNQFRVTNPSISVLFFGWKERKRIQIL